MGSNKGDPVDLTLNLVVDDVHEFKVDQSRRQIAGRVIPWGVDATDSRGMGKWRFNSGSLNWTKSQVGRVKLLRDHDPSQPVGKALSLEDRSDGLYGIYSVARGEEGDKVLSLAEDGVLDGFSAGARIEVDGWEMSAEDRSVRDVLNARLVETTVTALPAYDDARVLSVAASMNWNEEKSMAEKDDKSKIGDGGGTGGTTVLTDSDTAIEKFQQGMDQRFEVMADKIGETQEAQAEALTKTVTTVFESAFSNMEGAQAGHRAEIAAARIKLGREEPVYRFDGSSRDAPSMVKDFWRANTERDGDAVDRLRRFQLQQNDMVDMLVKIPPSARAQFAGASTGNAATNTVINEGYRPDLFVNELIQGRPIVAQASRGTITDATPFRVPRFVSMATMTDDHTEGTNPANGTMTLDSVTVDPGAISGRFELTREIVDAANPAIDAIALAAMRESYNQQTEVKAYAALNGAATGTGVIQPPGADDVLIGNLRTLLARYPFTRFAAPSGAVINQTTTVALATATDTTNRPLLPSVGAQNASGLGNAVTQGWFVDGLPFVPAWAMTDGLSDDVAIIVNRQDWWVWESPLLTFRFEEKQGPALIELALFAYFATHVLRPSGVFALRNAAA